MRIPIDPNQGNPWVTTTPSALVGLTGLMPTILPRLRDAIILIGTLFSQWGYQYTPIRETLLPYLTSAVKVMIVQFWLCIIFIDLYTYCTCTCTYMYIKRIKTKPFWHDQAGTLHVGNSVLASTVHSNFIKGKSSEASIVESITVELATSLSIWYSHVPVMGIPSVVLSCLVEPHQRHRSLLVLLANQPLSKDPHVRPVWC